MITICLFSKLSSTLELIAVIFPSGVADTNVFPGPSLTISYTLLVLLGFLSLAELVVSGMS